MFLGIEIGGTKLQLGVGQGHTADLETLERYHVVPSRGADGILAQIREAAPRLIRQHDVSAIGIGFGGPVDAAQGRVITSHQIDGWTDRLLGTWIQDELGLPAVLGNDCDCAAVAEARFGAGRDHRTVFYVTVGTGVGGGLVIDGHLHGADRPAVAEIGHLRPGLHADDASATVELLASGRAIAAAAHASVFHESKRLQDRLSIRTRPIITSTDRTDILERCGGDRQKITGELIAEAASAGNSAARSIILSATEALGWAVAQVITVVAPDVVIVGGGVSLIGDMFFESLRESVARYVFPPLLDSYDTKAAELGPEVVVHGAILIAANERG